MTQTESVAKAGKVLRRETVVSLLQAALDGGEFRFARQLALAWLSAFPGDLEVTVLQSRAILAEGRPAQAIPALELVCRKDPFYLAAYLALAQAYRGKEGTLNLDAHSLSEAETAVFVLRGWGEGTTETWGEPLRAAYQALQGRQYGEASRWIQEAFKVAPNLQLTAAMHLLVEHITQPPDAVAHLAQIYASRWPDCLLMNLVLADAYLDQGNEPEAVRLMHLCAANDSAGQVVRRMWGAEHPYRSLWPEEMLIHFDQPIPAAAAASMGWNQLPPGEPLPPASPEPVSAPAIEQEEQPASEAPVSPEAAADHLADADPLADLAPEETAAPGQTETAVETVESTAGSPPDPARPRRRSAREKTNTIHRVESEFERLAKKLKQPSLGRADGRFPVYVILSSRDGLTIQYGPQTTNVLHNEMHRLAGLIRKRRGWGAMLYYPDDAACTAQYGLTPSNPRDPWKVKHALADLDAALSKRGERIGALLIVGGDGVVPFHRLPNPTDDADGEVLSDNPYATLDANYFVPEWPVGRLIGEDGADAGLLLEQLRQLIRYHSRRAKGSLSGSMDWLIWVRSLFERLIPSRALTSFGYTAAVWRRSSLAVFRPIGAPHTVMASPPSFSGSFDSDKLTASSLGYYNLHGLEDSPSWYGQRDPQEKGNGPDYPVALSPDDLRRNGRSPRFIFSEACYGGHVLGKSENDSLALKFLAIGALGVIASTCIAYGSVSTPLIAADLLGHLFWQHMKSGRPAGEALMQAKIDLVREMNRRQGYLDGEDQKTLISFVLYGDPLCGYDGFRVRSKASPRSRHHPAVRTVCDRSDDGTALVDIPSEVLSQVKQAAAEYLPGADLGEFHFSRQHAACEGKGHHCPTSEIGAKTLPNHNGAGRLVVTVSKSVKVAHHLHRHYLRVTLDEEGKTVKMAISR